jgi:hypothetical protein
MKRTALVLLISCAFLATPSAQRGPDVSGHAKRAERIVVAKIISVVPSFERNAFGDWLIISHADIEVEESIKGTANQIISVDVEGGTVGGVTLRVSDMPSVAPGDRAVFFLQQSRQGVHIPQGRNGSVLKLDRSNRVQGTNLSLDDVKRLVQEGQVQK